jgi:microcystin-dependent protein
MDPFLGQLLLVGFNFEPINWAFAAGQLVPISRYTALFSLLGTNFGGNGTNIFGLPNLQGKLALGAGQSTTGTMYDVGEEGGTEFVTLDSNHLPSHLHAVMADILPASKTDPAGNAFARPTATLGNMYSSSTKPLVTMSSSAITPFQGGNQPHENRMPFLALNWIIALQGIFPQRQ